MTTFHTFGENMSRWLEEANSETQAIIGTDSLPVVPATEPVADAECLELMERFLDEPILPAEAEVVLLEMPPFDPRAMISWVVGWPNDHVRFTAPGDEELMRRHPAMVRFLLERIDKLEPFDLATFRRTYGLETPNAFVIEDARASLAAHLRALPLLQLGEDP